MQPEFLGLHSTNNYEQKSEQCQPAVPCSVNGTAYRILECRAYAHQLGAVCVDVLLGKAAQLRPRGSNTRGFSTLAKNINYHFLFTQLYQVRPRGRPL